MPTQTPSPPSSDMHDPESSLSYNSHSSTPLHQHQQPPQSPHPAEDTRLLPLSPSPIQQEFPSIPTARPARVGSFASSPLNPHGSVGMERVVGGERGIGVGGGGQGQATPFNSRPASRASTHHLLASHSSSRYTHTSTSPLFTGPHSDFEPFPAAGLNGAMNRGSMLLYRLADDPSTRESALLPPRLSFAPGAGGGNRDSVMSSTSSIISYTDSKYPSGLPTTRGYVAYAYDPADDDGPLDEEDLLHDPTEKKVNRGHHFPWRGIMNVGLLIVLILALLMLFVFYPMFRFYRDKARNDRIDGNIRINGTGQAPVLFQMPEMIDAETPDEAKTRTGYDGMEYELVFSDEFNTDGRSFYPGDDPFWEAVDIWYGATADLEWYDPSQITTRDGALVITMDSTTSGQFTVDENHGLQYKSGMLQSWNKFCFTTGYIEVAATFPGPNEDTQGYWPGAWTMGNLARPGYSATTDGMWPYTYDACDVGTFPNQTNPDGLGPAAALHSDASRSKYNFELSWLSGQRLSACSCPGSDHPGPVYNKGRGAPEIDIFEAEKDKGADHGQVVSLSSQFAPFSHDYVYPNDTEDTWWIYNTTSTRANTYKGSAVQQAISALTKLPSDMFQGSGANFKTLGFEYWSDPSNRGDGYITWQVDGQQTHRVGAAAVGPDQGPDGSGVSQRLISEEPMSIVLNLGISENWQTIDLSTMMFPAELKFDYVRVYQRKGQTNVGCNPKDYPTSDYIANHLDAYQNPNATTWNWPKPTNSLYAGGC